MTYVKLRRKLKALEEFERTSRKFERESVRTYVFVDVSIIVNIQAQRKSTVHSILLEIHSLRLPQLPSVQHPFNLSNTPAKDSHFNFTFSLFLDLRYLAALEDISSSLEII
jgi:hypothetical protein